MFHALRPQIGGWKGHHFVIEEGGQRMNLDLCQALARQLRADSIRCSTAAGSGHPTSSLSAADLMAVLLSTGAAAVYRRRDRCILDNRTRSRLRANRAAAGIRLASFELIGTRPAQSANYESGTPDDGSGRFVSNARAPETS